MTLVMSAKTAVQVVRAADGHIVAAASTVEAAQKECLSTRSDKVSLNCYDTMTGSAPQASTAARQDATVCVLTGV